VSAAPEKLRKQLRLLILRYWPCLYRPDGENGTNRAFDGLAAWQPFVVEIPILDTFQDALNFGIFNLPSRPAKQVVRRRAGKG
jgi:hypothetical protein